MATFTWDEIRKHNTETDCWIVVDNEVYDVTKFLRFHPGGKNILLKKGGQDASKEFWDFHSTSILKKYHPRLHKGTLSGSKAVVPSSSTPKWSPVIFGDPAELQGWKSPYFKESHYRLRAKMRAFVDEHIMPYCHQWDEAKRVPDELFRKCYEAGWVAMGCGPPWPTKWIGKEIFGGVITADEFDAFHEYIVVDEVSRCGSGGVVWGIFEGLSLGLPPVTHFGSDYLQQKVVADVMTGKKVICLAITEPTAGSDVARIRSTAKLTPDGKYYIVNGEKKWITNGVFADFFTVAVRTGGSGMGGISLLLLEKGMPGLKCRQMNCSGMWPSGTTYVTMEDVKVPVENLIGQEGQGFKYVMNNFNHERWWIIIQAVRFSRVCLEEAFKYAHKRHTFGKPMIDHPVIRFKIAEMARQVEAVQAWLDSTTYQMCNLPRDQQAKMLAGPIALLKAHATKTFEYCAREAAQVFGGLAYTRGGQAEKVERLYREVRGYAIPGGSEEILLDLGVRQAIKRTNINPKM